MSNLHPAPASYHDLYKLQLKLGAVSNKLDIIKMNCDLLNETAQLLLERANDTELQQWFEKNRKDFAKWYKEQQDRERCKIDR